MLEQHPADIWMLTKAHDDLAPGNDFTAVHSRPRPKLAARARDGSRWTSIWSRYTTVERIDCGDFDATRIVAGRLKSPVGDLIVVGVVLPWKGDKRHDWSEFDRLAALHVEYWRNLRTAYPQAFICIAGDWNQDMGTGSYCGTKCGIAILKSGLKSCDLRCVTASDRVSAGLPENPLIDHIAVPALWADRTPVVSGCPADRARLSDHSGVVVEVT